ncbi:MAG: hypothetical protein ACI89L_000736 [Phycisphaerales bacterium]|jgi:hypothetical protein
MSPIDPTQTNQANSPFKIANAYGAKPISVRPVPTDPRLGQTTAAGVPKSAITRGTDQLLAGSVNTQVDFMAGPPTQGTKPAATPAARAPGSSLAFYRHPADTNAAATSIDLGRSLDVEG